MCVCVSVFVSMYAWVDICGCYLRITTRYSPCSISGPQGQGMYLLLSDVSEVRVRLVCRNTATLWT